MSSDTRFLRTCPLHPSMPSVHTTAKRFSDQWPVFILLRSVWKYFVSLCTWLCLESSSQSTLRQYHKVVLCPPFYRSGHWGLESVWFQALAHFGGGCRSQKYRDPLWHFQELESFGKSAFALCGWVVEGLRGTERFLWKTLPQSLVVLGLDALQTPMCFQEVPLNTHKKCLFPMSHMTDLLRPGPF